VRWESIIAHGLHISSSAGYEHCVVILNWSGPQETTILKTWKVWFTFPLVLFYICPETLKYMCLWSHIEPLLPLSVPGFFTSHLLGFCLSLLCVLQPDRLEFSHHPVDIVFIM